MSKHKHYEAIIGWAENKTIQCRCTPNSQWNDITGTPGWHHAYEYRVKPVEYPKSSLSYNRLCNIHNEAVHEAADKWQENHITIGLRMAADEALEVFLKDEVAVMAWLKESGMIVEGSR